jgi:predicted dinucleotide-binding enzyme
VPNGWLRICMTTIGFIGSGHIGGTVAGLAIAAGHDVVLSNSRGQDTLVDLVTELGPHASAASTEDAAKQGEIVVVSIPLRAYQDVPVEPLAGKIVIDTNNYYWQRDGHFAEIDDESTTSAELLQRHLPTSRVVKAFNHIQYLQLAADGQPVGSDNRRALVIVGDDAGAKNVVTDLLDSFGYDVVDAGPLAEGWRFEPDHPAYGPRFTADEMREALAGARRRVRTD